MKHRNPLLIFIIILLASIFILVKGSNWDGSRRVTLVINADPMIIFSIEPMTKRAIFLTYPTNTLLDVPYDYATYPASSVFRLGELDNRYGGAKLFVKSVENTFGIAVEGYFSAKKGAFFFPLGEVSNLQSIKQTYFSYSGVILTLPKIVTLLKNINTDLPFIDLVRLWYAIKSIKSDRIVVFSLEKRNLLKENTQPDGSKSMIIDKDLLDSTVSDNFHDHLVRSENISIEVVNASGKEKVAAEFSRILSNMGANVVLKNTAEKNVACSCMIIAPSKISKGSHLVARIKQLYRCKESSEVAVGSQADVKIVLGEEFVR